MDGKDLPQPRVEAQANRELGLKFSGKSMPSPEHPNRNDDAIAVSKDGGFAIVCDGMGGLPNGDKASRAARNFLAPKLAELKPEFHPNAVADKMMRAMIDASKEVTAKAPGGATTMTAVKFLERNDQRKVVIGHIGDSKCYILRNGKLTQITQDERLEGTQNRVTNYLGGGFIPEPKMYTLDIFEGDRIILASDGIESLTQPEINEILRNNPQNPANTLVERAHQKSLRPGMRKDDISAVVVGVETPTTNVAAIAEQLPVSQKYAEHLSLMRRLEAAVSKPLDPNTPQEVVRSLIELSSSSELGYFDALATQTKLQGLFSVVSMKSALEDPAMRAKFFEAWKSLRVKGRVGQTLRDLQRLAGSDPGFFDRRGVYSLVNGTTPENYLEASPEAVKAVEQFNGGTRGEYLRDLLSKLPNVELGGGGGWMGMKSEKVGLDWQKMGFPKYSQILPDGGRIYINAKPQAMDAIFYHMAQLLNNEPGIPFDAKMIVHGRMDTQGLNRADKMVLYFDPKDQATILKIVQEVYGKYGSQAFDSNTPRFAAQLLDHSAAPMQGIAFGQEQPSAKLAELGPMDVKFAYTFNNLREGILLELKDLILRPDFDDHFRAKLKEQYIDTENPAFNFPPEKGQKLYPVIVANSI